MNRPRTAVRVGVACLVALLVLLGLPAIASAGVLERASLSSGGVQGDDDSYGSCISADGRYVAFYSYAWNLVSGDTNNAADIFVRDRVTGVTTRVSVSTGGGQTGFLDHSFDPSISADGRYVSFESDATNLVPSDTNGCSDIFVHDRVTGTTSRVSVSTGGAQANGASGRAAISRDGMYVAFQSDATNFVGIDTNGVPDVFVHNRSTGATTRVSVSSGEAQANEACEYPSISADGRYVAFRSDATNLVPADGNAATDVFVRDRTLGQTFRASLNSSGAEGNDDSFGGTISPDGRFVGFTSRATNLVPGDTNTQMDVFVRDLGLQITERISVSTGGAQGDAYSGDCVFSDGGRYAVFSSHATNLVSAPSNGWQQVFVRDRTLGTTTRVSENSAGLPGNGACGVLSITANGSLVTFTSEAPNLIAGDTNGFSDVFVAVGHVIYSSIRGLDRFDTALRVSRAMFPPEIYACGLPNDSGVVLAPGWESYQEALCGAPLAAAYGGPVLLSSKTVLYADVSNELVRLGPDYVFCIGLTTGLADAVRAVLPEATVLSINGTLNNVYHMSYLVAKKLGERVDATGGEIDKATGIVTIGNNFPDAIGVSALACYKKWPVLLTDYQDDHPMNTWAVQAMNELGITGYVKAGTYAPDPPGIMGLGNFSGADRYYTNANAAIWAQARAGLTFGHTALTTGDKFPDALAAGPYLAQDHGTLLLSPLPGPLPAPIAALITAGAESIQHFTFLACIEPVIGQVKGLLQ